MRFKLKTLSNLDRRTFGKYAANSAWMLTEQVLRIVSGVFVGIYIARYLGPEKFGILSYALAVAAFLTAVSRFGMDAVLVRELVNAERDSLKHKQLLGTSFWMMFLGGLVCFGLLLIGVWFTDESLKIKVYIAILSSGAMFSSFLVFDYFFQSQLKSKLSAICKVLSLATISIIKIGLVAVQADLIFFVLVFFLDPLLLGTSLYVTFKKNSGLQALRYFDMSLLKPLLKSAWPMVLSAVAIMLYMRIDQIMIRSMLGLNEVGLYSAAVKVYEAWMAIPYVISVSLLPAIVSLKKGTNRDYERGLAQIFRTLIWLSVFAAGSITVLGEGLLVLTFGNEYQASARILEVIMWTSIFAAMGSVSGRYFNVEHMEKKIATRTVAAAVMNIGLNLLLIPEYGARGAAVSTLICTVFANYIMDWFDRDLRQLLRIKHRSIFRFS